VQILDHHDQAVLAKALEQREHQIGDAIRAQRALERLGLGRVADGDAEHAAEQRREPAHAGQAVDVSGDLAGDERGLLLRARREPQEVQHRVAKRQVRHALLDRITGHGERAHPAAAREPVQRFDQHRLACAGVGLDQHRPAFATRRSRHGRRELCALARSTVNHAQALPARQR
jgi:hypothetical protein